MSTTATRSPLTGGCLAAVIAGGLVLLLSAMAALAGAGLTWASSKQDDGYYTTDHERIATSTYAVATDDLDVDGARGALGRIRVDVDADRPVFTGVARTRDVDAYLRGAARSEVSDLEYAPFSVTYATRPGTRAPGARWPSGWRGRSGWRARPPPARGACRAGGVA